MATEIFRIEGLEELESKLSDLMDLGRADKVAQQTLVKAAYGAMVPVYNEVLTTVPVGDKPRDERNPFHMKDTVTIKARIPNEADRKSTLVNQTDAAIAVVSVKKSAVSLAQEFGTTKIPAQSFLRPALLKHKDNVVTLFKADLEDYIREVAHKQARRK